MLICLKDPTTPRRIRNDANLDSYELKDIEKHELDYLISNPFNGYRFSFISYNYNSQKHL